MEAAALQPGERVLDVGCGVGETTLELATRVGSTGRARGEWTRHKPAPLPAFVHGTRRRPSALAFLTADIRPWYTPQAIGVDISAAQLAAARAQSEREGRTNVEFVLGDPQTAEVAALTAGTGPVDVRSEMHT